MRPPLPLNLGTITLPTGTNTVELINTRDGGDVQKAWAQHAAQKRDKVAVEVSHSEDGSLELSWWNGSAWVIKAIVAKTAAANVTASQTWAVSHLSDIRVRWINGGTDQAGTFAVQAAFVD